MAKLDAHAEPALVEPAVEDQAAADSSAKSKIDDIVHAGGRAKTGLAQRRAVRVIRDANRPIRGGRKQWSKWNVAPTRQIRGKEHDASARIKRSW